jgi:hypothetical protein
MKIRIKLKLLYYILLFIMYTFFSLQAIIIFIDDFIYKISKRYIGLYDKIYYNNAYELKNVVLWKAQFNFSIHTIYVLPFIFFSFLSVLYWIKNKQNNKRMFWLNIVLLILILFIFICNLYYQCWWWSTESV